MRTFLISSAVIGMSAFALHCGDDASSTCNGVAECSSPMSDGDAGGTDGSSGGTDGGVPIPPGCDPTADAKDAPKCVVNEFGVFVDAAKGNDGNSGSKELPMKTIGGALGKLNGKSRVYVCEGTYAESVKVTSAVSIYGGFACADWSYSGVAAKVAPSASNHALHLTKIDSPIVISDLELTSTDAVEPGGSSIAVFVSETKDALFRRTKIYAGKGLDAPTVGAFATNMFGGDPKGNDVSGAIGALAKTCACPAYGASVGGKGGNGGTNASKNGENGGDGSASPVIPPPVMTFNGKGGFGAADPAGGCSVGTAGAYGEARNGGEAASNPGIVTANGWEPGDGKDGAAGNPGQGGGGGGDNFTNGGAGGGGGGCGGCGGAGGKGGRAGGSSIAVLAFASSVTLDASSLKAADAGNGASGGAGEAGGAGGAGTAGACSGRAGGNGAGGSGGAGGAGGVSSGFVGKGVSLKIDGGAVASVDAHERVTVGKAGGKGTKGGAGAAATAGIGGNPGNDGADGADGKAAAVLFVD